MLPEKNLEICGFSQDILDNMAQFQVKLNSDEFVKICNGLSDSVKVSDDHPYKVCDVLTIREFDAKVLAYTGRFVTEFISSVERNGKEIILNFFKGNQEPRILYPDPVEGCYYCDYCSKYEILHGRSVKCMLLNKSTWADKVSTLKDCPLWERNSH